MIHYLIPCALIALFVIGWKIFKPKYKEPGIVINMPQDVIEKEWRWLYARIKFSSTLPELAWCQELVFDFEEQHRSHADMEEYFNDLLIEANNRFNELSAKQIKADFKYIEDHAFHG